MLYVCTVRRENIHSIEWCQFLPGPGRHYNFSLQEPGCGLSVTFEPLEVINFNPVVLSCPKQSQTILSISATSSTTNRVISNSLSWRNWSINCFKHRKVTEKRMFLFVNWWKYCYLSSFVFVSAIIFRAKALMWIILNNFAYIVQQKVCWEGGGGGVFLVVENRGATDMDKQ